MEYGLLLLSLGKRSLDSWIYYHNLSHQYWINFLCLIYFSSGESSVIIWTSYDGNLHLKLTETSKTNFSQNVILRHVLNSVHVFWIFFWYNYSIYLTWDNFFFPEKLNCLTNENVLCTVCTVYLTSGSFMQWVEREGLLFMLLLWFWKCQ